MWDSQEGVSQSLTMADDIIFKVIMHQSQQQDRCQHIWWGRCDCSSQVARSQVKGKYCSNHSCTGKDAMGMPCDKTVIKTDIEPLCLQHYLRVLVHSEAEQRVILAQLRWEQTFYDPANVPYQRMEVAIHDLQHLSSRLHNYHIVLALFYIGMIDRQQASSFIGDSMPPDW